MLAARHVDDHTNTAGEVTARQHATEADVDVLAPMHGVMISMCMYACHVLLLLMSVQVIFYLCLVSDFPPMRCRACAYVITRHAAASFSDSADMMT